MKKIVAVVGLLSLLELTYLYFARVPLRSGYLGPVRLSVQQFKTNALGQVTATVAINNGGPHVIRFAVGTQRLQNSEWVDSVSGTPNGFNLSIDPDPLISPHSEKSVSVAVPGRAPGTWRVYAMCSKEYPPHWSKPLRWIANAYVLKRGVVEHFYSAEVQ